MGWHEREAASLCVGRGGEGKRIEEWEGGRGEGGGGGIENGVK